MTDKFSHYADGLESPPRSAFSIAPNDSEDLAHVTRAINVATTGNVRVTTLGGDTATIFIVAGIAFPIRAERVWATDTTATGIVGLS